MAVMEAQRKQTERRLPQKRALRGPEKAAILFLCLGEQRGSALMQKLTDEEIQIMTRAMAGLGVIEADQVEQVMSDFVEGIANGGGVVGSFTVAEDMLRSFLPSDQVDGILKDIRGPLMEKDLWTRFSSLSENVIANYLRNEHEQTCAAILSNVKNDVAAKVLPLLGQEKMHDVVERMIRMEAVPHHMMKQIEETLQTDIISAPAQPTSGELQQKMADLFNKLDVVSFQQLSEDLEQRIPETFSAIKSKMFTFDDLANLNAMDLARVMRGAPGNALPIALRGAKKEVRDVFLAALPGRSRDMLEEEMNTMGPVRGKDVREAQAGLLDYAKELADEEVIALPMADDEEFI
ncbi:flagellar motor switch protein FliG [Primorskyibacter flagellatus]|mgnify:CR=1 FL=1|jgi:flagellar motor switch protein FliG|uniref:Flagellar motor switch protein FliG n=1 Tax=Primorskyibacter flagellatus TaxID=1387277 RepID=A0A917EKW7_9RHOB|nr:flagellar motor switch protein FliG [Primorskyibacter flagellatus]GGE50791.1 flagellar motor switch protein FliG [Primorskyibacter flagellatus]